MRLQVRFYIPTYSLSINLSFFLKSMSYVSHPEIPTSAMQVTVFCKVSRISQTHCRHSSFPWNLQDKKWDICCCPRNQGRAARLKRREINQYQHQRKFKKLQMKPSRQVNMPKISAFQYTSTSNFTSQETLFYCIKQYWTQDTWWILWKNSIVRFEDQQKCRKIFNVSKILSSLDARPQIFLK